MQTLRRRAQGSRAQHVWRCDHATTRVVTVAFFLCSSNAVAQHPTAAEPYHATEAYLVYSVLLPHEEAVESATGTLVVREETVSNPEAPEPCSTPESAVKFKDAIAGYKQENGKPWLLQREFQSEKPYEIVNSDTLDVLLKQDGWDAFYRRYPGSGGYVILSAVGFNPAKTQAIAYTGSACGSLCGTWRWHLMEKIAGKWKESPGVSCVTVS